MTNIKCPGCGSEDIHDFHMTDHMLACKNCKLTFKYRQAISDEKLQELSICDVCHQKYPTIAMFSNKNGLGKRCGFCKPIKIEENREISCVHCNTKSTKLVYTSKMEYMPKLYIEILKTETIGDLITVWILCRGCGKLSNQTRNLGDFF